MRSTGSKFLRPSLVLLVALAGCGEVQTFTDAGTDGTVTPPIDAPIDGPDTPTTATLTLVKGGAGSGTVSSSPAGIDCGATCNFTFPIGTVVTLSATPGTGASFTGWGGACAGGLPTCSITLDADKAVNADFAVLMHTVTVAVGGNGTGTVTSSTGSINCPGVCTATVPYGTAVTLTAAATAPSMFLGWSGGGCTGAGACTVNVTGDVTVNASFALNYTLVVTRAGNGNGAVTSSPAGINCGADCDQTYPAGTSVTLTATASPDSTFTGWSGSGCSGTGTCTVAVNGATAVVATFTLRQYTLTANKNGSGVGTVTSTPGSINCGAVCSGTFDHGTSVTLSATPTGAGNTFAGWSGGGCTGTGACTVTLTAATTVTATFNVTTHTLSVVRAGNGVGTVTSAPAGVSCGNDCATTVNYGTMITLTATAATSPLSAESTFTGWSGGGCTGTGTCTVTVTAATTVTATFALIPNIVFVTSTRHQGNLGGLAGADAICQARADSVNMRGTYRAWLSSSTTSAFSRLGTASGWVRPDGKPVFNSRADLQAGRQMHPIRIHERIGDVGEVAVRTASLPEGTLHPNGTTCGDYTSLVGSIGQGVTIGMSSQWSSWSTGTCDSLANLYCFGVDRAATVVPTPAANYRRAFVAGPWTPGGGIASADARCQSDASAAGLPGTYRALLAQVGASAMSRFNVNGLPWGRPDGILIAPTALGFFNPDGFWDSAPNTNAANTFSLGNNGSWGGATTPTTAGNVDLTCGNWMSTQGTTGGGGRTGFTSVGRLFNMDTGVPCSANYYQITCLQE